MKVIVPFLLFLPMYLHAKVITVERIEEITKNSEENSNIVVVVCDSMDGRLLPGGRYDGVVQLPAIKEMAEQGTTYLNAYTNNPICVPSRSALWSGMHTHITESWNNYKGLPPNFNMTWADRLQREAGYQTKILGKVDFASGSHTLSNRVEAWTRNVNFTLRQEGRPTVQLIGNSTTKHVNLIDWEVVDEAKAYISNMRQEKLQKQETKPFLLYVGLRNPHPYIDPGVSWFRTSPYWLNKVSKEQIHIPPWIDWDKMHPVDKYSSIVKNCSSEFGMEELVNIKSYFYAMNAETDAMLGEVLASLSKNDFDKDTYVLFTSDHGELAMEHRQFYKMSMYEGSSHVPLLVRTPQAHLSQKQQNMQGGTKGTLTDNSPSVSTPSISTSIVSTPVSLIDIYPTLMDIARLSKPPYLNGTSLFFTPKSWVISQYHGCNVNASTYMLRTGPWKYITFDYGPNTVPPLLFNLDNDPDELENLAPAMPGQVNVFEKFLQEEVDYPSVTSKVREYNRQAFSAWRRSEGKDYDNAIANLRWWMDWQSDPQGNQKAVDRWLNQNGEGRE